MYSDKNKLLLILWTFRNRCHWSLYNLYPWKHWNLRNFSPWCLYLKLIISLNLTYKLQLCVNGITKNYNMTTKECSLTYFLSFFTNCTGERCLFSIQEPLVAAGLRGWRLLFQINFQFTTYIMNMWYFSQWNRYFSNYFLYFFIFLWSDNLISPKAVLWRIFFIYVTIL